jgi:hypothetical protein
VAVFGSSGGAVPGLAMVTRHRQGVRTLVAHEPPLTTVLPDADAAARAYPTRRHVVGRSPDPDGHRVEADAAEVPPSGSPERR